METKKIEWEARLIPRPRSQYAGLVINGPLINQLIMKDYPVFTVMERYFSPELDLHRTRETRVKYMEFHGQGLWYVGDMPPSAGAITRFLMKLAVQTVKRDQFTY